MDFYVVWPTFLCFAILFLLVSTAPFRQADALAGALKSRVTTIDGLRGFLALGVFFQHAMVYYQFMTTGVWTSPPSPFFNQLSQSSVAVFFMITGYLFWTRLLRAQGRPGFLALYIGRVFRIGPLYIFMLLCMLIIVFWRTAWHLEVSPASLSWQVLIWSGLGIPGLWPDVNGLPNTAQIVADVVWTLHYEWIFYASLLSTSFIARLSSWHLPIVALVWVGCLLEVQISGVLNQQIQCLLLFLSGMLVGSLMQAKLVLNGHNAVSSGIVVVLVYCLFTVCSGAYNIPAILMLATCFYLVVSGSTVFGLLTHRGSRRLGDISYGIYLLQGLVLYLTFAVPDIRHFALQAPVPYWVVVSAAAGILVASATIAHGVIELPGMALGAKLGTFLNCVPKQTTKHS